MIKYAIFCIFASIVLISNNVHATITPFTAVPGKINTAIVISKTIDVVYLNGIDNAESDAQSSLRKLSSRYINEKNGKYLAFDVRFSYIYNPTAGKWDDDSELESMGDITTAARAYADKRIQRIASIYPDYDASTRSRLWNAIYRARLRTLYSDIMVNAYKENSNSEPAIGSVIQKIYTALSEKILAGHKVVVVSHSQGNLFAEATHAYMVQHMTDEQMKAIRFVGVASVASTIPNDGYYTSFVQDEAISAYEAFHGKALARNFDAVRMEGNDPKDIGWDELCHNFIDYYMDTNIVRRGDSDRTQPYENNVAKKIITDIDNSIDQCVPVSSQIRLSFLTATLTWVNSNTDIDLWMYEPNSDELTKIYYGNKTGTTGYLDLDDVDGFGPEHIFMENKVSDLSGTYYIWAHAFNAPSGDVATIGINFNNYAVYSRTFDLLDQAKQCVFKLILAKQNTYYDYTLSACE